MKNPPIIIEHVHGGADKHDLKHCYFQETDVPNTFHFFRKDGTRIHTEPSRVKSREDFSFKLPVGDLEEINFEVTQFYISGEELCAHGHWSAPRRGKFGDGDPDPETGTFQAPGGHPEELSASASTSA